jgi:hypothetical protein
MAGQAIYRSASANSNVTEPSQMLASRQPMSAGVVSPQTTEETCLAGTEKILVPGTEIDACQFGGDEANRLAREGILINSNSSSNYIDLEAGNILLAPEKDIIVGTHLGKISILSGATVFISQCGDDIMFYDLLQTKPKQVSVTVANKQKINLEPGRMLVLTKQNTDDFEKLEMNCHCVAYQNAKPIDLHNTMIKAFAADFSIASALVTIEPLKELTISCNKQDKLTVDRLVKGAVILGDFVTDLATSTSSVHAQIADEATGVEAGSTNIIQVADADGK